MDVTNEWQNIVGHEWAVEVLRAAIAHDRVGHAYLITGPSQVGKGTLARTFAQALNCTAADPVARPCGRCRSCTLIAASRHPDVKNVAGESSGRGKVTLKIDQIRQLQSDLNLTAAEAKFKVAILEDFEKATKSAANALLKTLEEPPGQVVLILTAAEGSTLPPTTVTHWASRDTVSDPLWDESDSLLPTIISRCRVIALRPLPASVIESALVERWDVEPAQARILAHLANGRLGLAVMLTQNPLLLEERAANLELLYGSFGLSRVERFAAAERLARRPEELPDLLRLWLSYWRDLVLIATAGPEAKAVSNVDQLDRLRAHAQAWPVRTVLDGLRHTEQALWQLERNANTRLVIENVLLAYPSRQTAPA